MKGPGKGSAICGRARPIHQTAGCPISAVPVHRVVPELNAFRCNPLSSKYKKAAVESLPPEKATRKKSYSAKSGTL